MLGLIPEGFGEAYINQHTAMVRPMPEMQGRFLPELFRSPFAQAQFNEPQRGIKNSFRLTDITQFVVPLPPLAEQHRIVAKIDELMDLCDRLEAAREAREATRDRLAAASLARLDTPDPDAFKDDGRFALEALPTLTTRPDQIKRLRQAILNLAVRGKLVAQDTNEEPAVDGLRAVEELKAKQSIKKPKKVAPIEDADKWCASPKGWVWARWDQITDWITYGFTRPMEHVKEGIPIVTGKNVNEGRIIFETASLTPLQSFNELTESRNPVIF